MSRVAHARRAAVLVAALAVPLAGPALHASQAAHPASAPPSARGAATVEVEPSLAAELARLDERLGLGTYPDGTAAWIARLTAAAERRARGGRCTPGASPDLLRRLAGALRGLVPEAPTDNAADVTDSVRTLHAKLDRLGRSVDANLLGALATPGNDDCSSPFTLVDGQLAGTTLGASTDGSASCGSSSSSPDVWFRYTSPATRMTTFHTDGSGFDTVLSVHDGCPDGGSSVELACNDDAGGSLHSEVTLQLAAGQEVLLRLSGYAGAAGDYVINARPSRGIAGTVTRSDTGEPLAGATVLAYGPSGGVEGTAVTGADGTYVFGLLPSDPHTVWAGGLSGFIGELYDDVPCPPWSTCSPGTGTPVEVTEGLATDVDFALEPAGRITGTLTEVGSAIPLSGFVRLYSSTGVFLNTFQTAADGTYEAHGLPRGKYVLRAETDEHRSEFYDDVPCSVSSCSFEDGLVIAVFDAATVSGIDFVLDRLPDISGRVTHEVSGLPLAGTSVRAYDDRGRSQQSALSDSDGAYRLSSMEPGTYYVATSLPTSSLLQDEVYDDIPCPPRSYCDVTAGTPVVVTLSSSVSGIDFALSNLARIAGTVTHTLSGEPASVTVAAYDLSGSRQVITTTSAAGTYTLDGLAQGSYRVRTLNRSYTDPSNDVYVHEIYPDVRCTAASCPLSAGDPVEAAPNTVVEGVDLALDRWGMIAGTAFAAKPGAVLNLEALAYDESGALRRVGAVSLDGSYTITGLAPGSYAVKLSAVGSSPAIHDELYDDVPCKPHCDVSQGAPVSTGFNTVSTGVDFAVGRCTASNSYEELVSTTFLSTHTAEACEEVKAHSGTTVAPGADVTFRSGGRIALGDGFSVQSGARFTAVIEPAWSDD